MGGVVEEDEVGGLCCVEELIMYLRRLIFESLGEGAGRVKMVGLRTVFLSFFLSFSFHCVCDMEVTSLIYINHKISSLHY